MIRKEQLGVETVEANLDYITKRLGETNNFKAIATELGLNDSLILLIRHVLECQRLINAAESDPGITLDYPAVHAKLNKFNSIYFMDLSFTNNMVDLSIPKATLYREINELVFDLKTRVHAVRIQRNGIEEFVNYNFMRLKNPSVENFHIRALLCFRKEVLGYIEEIRPNLRKQEKVNALSAILNLQDIS